MPMLVDTNHLMYRNGPDPADVDTFTGYLQGHDERLCKDIVLLLGSAVYFAKESSKSAMYSSGSHHETSYSN